jgi:hypothetical protein
VLLLLPPLLLLLTIWVEALVNLGKKARPEGCQTAARSTGQTKSLASGP